MDNKSKSKGKSWVGNIYHKFESICEDVDGIVSQHPVKYVGNQVQTVGRSMKIFCSEVMQDLIMPQVNPTKHEVQSVSLKPDASESSSKQVVDFEKNDQLIDTKQSNKELDAISLTMNHNQLLYSSSSVNEPVSVPSLFMEIGEDIGGESSSYLLKDENKLVDEGPLEEKSLSEESELLFTNVNDASTCENNECEAQSCSESDIEFDDSELAVVGGPEDFVDDITEPCMETISLNDEVKPHDNGVIMDSNVFLAVSHTAKNFRSYKKKIHEAFTSKRRLAKEYEQLGIWYGDIDTDMECSQKTFQCSLPSVPANSLDSKKVPKQDLCDWELL